MHISAIRGKSVSKFHRWKSVLKHFKSIDNIAIMPDGLYSDSSSNICLIRKLLIWEEKGRQLIMYECREVDKILRQWNVIQTLLSGS